MDSLAFLGSLFADAVGPRSRIVVWSAKRSTWCESAAQASGVCAALDPHGDVYFGVALQDPEAALEEAIRRSDEKHGHHNGISLTVVRGFATTARAIGGAWCDLDVDGPGRKKTGLPKSVAAIHRALDLLPLRPTWRIFTGGGIHAWWRFKEPWVLEDDAERARARRLVEGWQREIARQSGFTVDPTADLARVLRPPGTTSHKYGEKVRLDASEALEFNPSDFEEWQAEEAPARPAAGESPKHRFVLRPDAEPPLAKVETLRSMDARFARTWARQRPDFPSQSEYDLALATMASRAGWSPQDTVDLLIAHRRMHLLPDKLRVDYYENRLALARVGVDGLEAHERLVDVVSEPKPTTPQAVEEERARLNVDLSKLLGFKVLRVIRYLGDPPAFRLELPEGKIDLGDVDSILLPSRFRSRVAAVSLAVIRQFKGHEWGPIAQAILRACEDRDLGSDSTIEAVVEEWVGSFLADNPPALDKKAAVASRRPWADETGVYLFLAELQSWVTFHGGERLGRKALAQRLRTYGATPSKTSAARDGSMTSYSVWRVGGVDFAAAYMERARARTRAPIRARESAEEPSEVGK